MYRPLVPSPNYDFNKFEPPHLKVAEEIVDAIENKANNAADGAQISGEPKDIISDVDRSRRV